MIIRELVHLRELNLVRTSCYSMDLDGLNEYIEAPINAAFDLTKTDSMTFAAWVKFDNMPSFNPILNKWIYAVGIQFNVSSTGEIQFHLQNNGGIDGLIMESIGAGISNGVWNHIAATYDGSNTPAGVKFYINGSILANAIITNTLTGIITNSETVKIGATPSAGFYSNGLFNKVRWWDVELTPAEILYQYNNKTGTPSQPLSLILNLDINNSTWNGSEYDIVDNTGITAGYQTVNAEEADKIQDCP